MAQHSFKKTITHNNIIQVWSNAVGEKEPLVTKTKAELVKLNSDIKMCRIVFKHYAQKNYWLLRIQNEFNSRK